MSINNVYIAFSHPLADKILDIYNVGKIVGDFSNKNPTKIYMLFFQNTPWN